MNLEPVDGSDARAVLRGLRGAVLGAGPAIALGGGDLPHEVPAGTAVVVTTSGSTGHPKSVAISRAALTSSALATADRLGAGAWLLALPAGYIAGVQVLVRSLVAGREPAILAGSFSAHAFAAAAAAMASSDGGVRVPTYTSLVPAQLQTVLDAIDGGDTAAARALEGFEAILVGGQALAPALAERAAAVGARIVRTYGSSETSGGCVYDGIPLPGVGVRIDEGEVQLSGPTLADGYLGDPEQTARVFVRDGATRWYRTGDLGSFDDGRLRVTGRADNVIISGGVNVSLDRVERAVRTIEGLADAVVVPVSDERWGQASVVVTAARVDADDATALVRAAVEAEIGKAARPREVLVVDRLPLLPSGKPDRTALRALAADAAAAG
ncbi:MAG: acyl-CoA synthetase [Microbacterium sp. SCN 70-200]|uniref:AMP-binding protein n=1 Tax=unclassified Microbacterium TaxID=2609290 RepID=UPI00086AD102|nr:MULTISPECIES: AMP-binding protein [unclassified Microbacterium]MBN9215675.1 AMP-binding protein [Microbacterium sp.]ODT41288.1 MAG: acyl-CoA synthetase [Microbacterium sp. SCN 70-200]OJV81733.1 MAG: acyl-CoA synthetase [Microbacterium sp. 70-16]